MRQIKDAITSSIGDWLSIDDNMRPGDLLFLERKGAGELRSPPSPCPGTRMIRHVITSLIGDQVSDDGNMIPG